MPRALSGRLVKKMGSWKTLAKSNHEDEVLLKAHRLHAGIYRRVANKLGVDASYVSRVAVGKRKASKIRSTLLDELRKIQRLLS
jgi:hypothetical protein